MYFVQGNVNTKKQIVVSEHSGGNMTNFQKHLYNIVFLKLIVHPLTSMNVLVLSVSHCCMAYACTV
jgi:hypothetical protein